MRPRAALAAFLALLALAALLAGAGGAGAIGVRPDERHADPALEERARSLGKELRCLVCQNQSIDDSDADLARDLRILVRERLVAGDSDREVIDYVAARYGDFVLLDPPMKPSTWILWFGPGVLGAIGLAGVVIFFRRRTATAAAPLDDAERARLDELLRAERPGGGPGGSTA